MKPRLITAPYVIQWIRVPGQVGETVHCMIHFALCLEEEDLPKLTTHSQSGSEAGEENIVLPEENDETGNQEIGEDGINAISGSYGSLLESSIESPTIVEREENSLDWKEEEYSCFDQKKKKS